MNGKNWKPKTKRRSLWPTMERRFETVVVVGADAPLRMRHLLVQRLARSNNKWKL